MTQPKTCKNGCKTDRLIMGLCPLCYQRSYEYKKKLLSTTRAPKKQMTKAQANARAMNFKYKPHDIQKWSYEKIIRLWERIEI